MAAPPAQRARPIAVWRPPVSDAARNSSLAPLRCSRGSRHFERRSRYCRDHSDRVAWCTRSVAPSGHHTLDSPEVDGQPDLTPVLCARWDVRGSDTIQGVECRVRSPNGGWKVCTWPRGRLAIPKDDLYTYINLTNGQPFNTTLSSPLDYGRATEDITDLAVKGKYKLRLTWHEEDHPKRKRQQTFSYTLR